MKQAVKQRQRASARRRMMAAVPRATVVVTNPTHFAVALEWDEITMDAPVLTCKGADLMARRIRELASEHGIPIMENPPLARALYDKVELDSPVPRTCTRPWPRSSPSSTSSRAGKSPDAMLQGSARHADRYSIVTVTSWPL